MSSRRTRSFPTFTPQRIAQGLRRESKEPERTNRLPVITVDIVSLAKGAIVVGEFLARRAASKKVRRQKLRTQALQLAEQFQGFLGIPDLIADGRCSHEEARNCLESLENALFCRFLCLHHGQALYVFPAFLTKVWSCDFCASEFAVPEERRSVLFCGCPNCGAMMRQSVAI